MKSKEGRPYLTYAIIVVSVLVMLNLSLLPASTSDVLYNEYALNPSNLRNGVKLIGVVSYIFLSANWVNLLVNSFALWGVETVIEREMGSVRFGLVFLVSGVVAGLTYVVMNWNSSLSLIGASGAIFGVLAVLLMLTPFKKTSLFIVPLPAIFVGIIVVSIEVATLVWSKASWVAHDALLAGIFTGIVAAF